jgi:hypothetical protein
MMPVTVADYLVAVYFGGVARDRVRCLLRSYCPDYRSVRSPYQHHLRDTVSHPH